MKSIEELEEAYHQERKKRLELERALHTHEIRRKDELDHYHSLQRTIVETTLFLNIAQLTDRDYSLDEILKRFVESVCQAIDWPIGHLYVYEGGTLSSFNIWNERSQRDYPGLVRLIEDRQDYRQSLAALAYTENEFVWADSFDRNPPFYYSNLAVSLGLKRALAFPVHCNGFIVAVAEFMTTEYVECSEHLTTVLNSAAKMLGTALERRIARNELRVKYQELEKALTQLKSTQTQLIHAEKIASLGVIAAGIAHELNTPVGYVMSNFRVLDGYLSRFKSIIEMIRAAEADTVKYKTDLLKQVDATDMDYVLSDSKQLIEESLQGLEHVKNIVQDLKLFSRIDQPERQPVDITECIAATLRILQHEIKGKCRIHQDLSPLPKIMCVPGQLNQVFMNLILNAAQSIENEGDIYIESSTVEDNILIRIRDTGRGIPEETVSKLFTPFFTTKPAGKGTGLGLSISYNIIQKHGGHIFVESQEGQGTAFTIILPVVDEGG